MTARRNEGVVAAIAVRAHKAGLRTDIAEARLARVARYVAARHDVDISAVARPPLVDEAVEQLAVHQSWFFRDARQLGGFTREIVPTLTPPLHVWCVGCANGQEAWTLAILLTDAVEGEWNITASDYSATAVERARSGLYTTAELRGLSAEHRSRFVDKHGPDEWSMSGALRSRVAFVQHNISVQPAPLPPASCDVVLCRNVLIYLHSEAVTAALTSIKRTMTREGWLLLGSAESLFGVTDELTAVPLGRAYAYRDASAPPKQLRAAPRTKGRSPVDSRERTRRERVAPLPDIVDLLDTARRAAGDGDFDTAVRAFRQAAYLDPQRRDAHAGLADALDAVGDHRGATRARAAARRLCG